MSATQARIRAAEVADAAAIAAIDRAAFAQPWATVHIDAALTAPSSQGWVTEIHDNIQAFVLITVVLDELSIDRIGVHPDLRRLGLARDLLRHVLHDVPDLAVAHLEVAADNEPAIALYRQLGFVDGRTRKDYYGNGRDALDMHLQLT